MKHKNHSVIFAALIVLTFIVLSCRKEKEFDRTPEISFKSAAKSDSLHFKVVVGFSDGDGDIGFEEGDTLPPYNPGSVYYYNYYLKLFYKENGSFKELITPVPYSYRIPLITPGSRNKNITGEIAVDGLYFSTGIDTLKCEVYIYDRALNKSNVVETDEFVFN